MTPQTQNYINEQFLLDLNKVIDIDLRFEAEVRDNWIALSMVEDDKIIFGSTITIYTMKHLNEEERRFEINSGYKGSFDLGCEASVGRCLAMAEIIKNFYEVKAICFKYCEDYYRIENNIKR